MATVKFETTKEKEAGVFEALKGDFGYTNVMQAPRIEKVIVSTGVGSTKDKNKLKVIEERMATITGQKAAVRRAKKSIATFKVREGDVSGYQVTLRGKRMYDFLDRLLSIALPRTRDFRGISPDSVDEVGNYTMGVKEHTIFPETVDEELKNVFGFAVTVVTTAEKREETKAMLTHLGFPFKKEQKSK
ncbi:50S ribosomal protein L5 [Candidatus Wolfebacteria bacterium]|nr:MAG: 50S ribosomal protein L5 [Candidatus Wolfebacteria bacterium]